MKNEEKPLLLSGNVTPPKKPHIVKRIFKWIFRLLGYSILVALLLSLIGVGVAYVKYKPVFDKARTDAFAKESSISEKTFKRAGSTTVLDKDGKQIALVSNSTYKYIPLAEVASYVQDGYIAVEDKNFLTEGGISYQDTAQAIYLYIKNKGKATMGGSTITQQLIKMTLLTQDQTVSRKATEILIALQMPKRFTKAQILEFYVNNCYYGNGNYGVESASQYYFSKPASKLTLAEAATLVGLSNNPTMFDPITKPEKCVERRNTALYAMLVNQKITQEDYDKAKKVELKLAIKKPPATEENYLTSYAIDCTVRALMEKDGFQFKYWFDTNQEREDYRDAYRQAYQKHDKDVRSGGYTIHTSLDLEKQAILQKALDNNLASFTDTDPATKKYAMQGAAVSIDNKTGYVVAIVGGRGDNDIFNRGFLAFRQPGSTIKPLIDYTPAFDHGYHPLTKVTDKKIDKGPKNFQNSFYGPVTLRYATEISLNTVPYQLLMQIKPLTGLKYLAEMQFAGLHPYDNNPIVSIGGFTTGVTPVEQAGGYYALANGGYYVQPSCVTKVVHLGIDTIYTNDRQGKQVYTPESAFMMTDILKGVMQQPHGTGYPIRLEGQITTGKTGTTEDNKDAWFAGYSAYYTTVVWAGYDMPRPVENLYGSTYPGRIWLDYMKAIHTGLPTLDFQQPAGITYKNVDYQGNYTNTNTGTQDMMSQPYQDKQDEAKRLAEIKEAADRQKDWQAHEVDREKNAKNLVVAYEAMHYTARANMQPTDQAYNDAIEYIKILDNKDMQDELTRRVNVHKSAIAKERQALQNAIDKEVADALAKQKEYEEKVAKAKVEAELKAKQEEANATVAKQQRELQLEQEAEYAVKNLEALPKSSDKGTVLYRLSEAQNRVALVTNSEKHANFTKRINAVRDDFGI